MLAKVAVDFGFVKPQAACDFTQAGQTQLSAAIAYTATKRSHNQADIACEGQGIDYQPVVFETTGGVAKEGRDTLNSINRLVAHNTDTPYPAVAQRFWQSVSMILQKANHRALVRRLGVPSESSLDPCTSALQAASVLEVAP